MTANQNIDKMQTLISSFERLYAFFFCRMLGLPVEHDDIEPLIRSDSPLRDAIRTMAHAKLYELQETNIENEVKQTQDFFNEIENIIKEPSIRDELVATEATELMENIREERNQVLGLIGDNKKTINDIIKQNRKRLKEWSKINRSIADAITSIMSEVDGLTSDKEYKRLLTACLNKNNVSSQAIIKQLSGSQQKNVLLIAAIQSAQAKKSSQPITEKQINQLEDKLAQSEKLSELTSKRNGQSEKIKSYNETTPPIIKQQSIVIAKQSQLTQTHNRNLAVKLARLQTKLSALQKKSTSRPKVLSPSN